MINVFTTAKALLKASPIRKVKFQIELADDGNLVVLYQAHCPVDENDQPEIVKIKSGLTQPLLMTASASLLDQNFSTTLGHCMTPVLATANQLGDMTTVFEEAATAAKEATQAATAQKARDKAAAAKAKTRSKSTPTATPSAAEVAAATAQEDKKYTALQNTLFDDA